MAKFKPYCTEQGQLLPTYLSDWVAQDHLARLISEIVDQLDLTEITSKYSSRGEEAYHPALLCKLWFYGYATGVFTSRQIRRALDENIPFRWLSGDNRPDFRTISDFRKNHLGVLPALFGQTVQAAAELGYVTLGHVSIDGSKIKAHASKHKAMSRDRMKQEIARLEQEMKEALAVVEEDRPEDMMELFPRSADERMKDHTTRLEKIRQALHDLEERRPEAESRTPEKDQINFTDPESRIMDTRTQGVIQGYNPQIAVDGDHGIIVGLHMSENSSDQNQFADVLKSIEQHAGCMPKKITADAGYFSSSNIVEAQHHGIDAYIAAGKEGKQAKNPYDKTNFAYDAQSDRYRCPAGKEVVLKQTQQSKDPNGSTKWIYECSDCPVCPFQRDCAKGRSGKRTITRTEADPIREAMRTKVQSDEGKAIYSRRKGIVEPTFGEIKEVMGFRQFHLRGKEKVSGEFTLLAISYNLRRYHSARYPKPATQYKRERSAQKQKRAA